MQVLSDICLALLPNEQGSKGSLLSGCSDHPPRLVTFLVPQVLNLSSLYEPSSSSGREASPTYTSFNPHVCLYPCTPHTPAQGQSWGSVCQATLLTEEAHSYLPSLLQATGAQNRIICHLVFSARSLAPTPRKSFLVWISVLY